MESVRLDVGWGGGEAKTARHLCDAGFWVEKEDLPERPGELALEVASIAVAGAELGLESGPGDTCWPPEIAVPVGEPAVDVERQRAA